MNLSGIDVKLSFNERVLCYTHQWKMSKDCNVFDNIDDCEKETNHPVALAG